MKKSYTTERIFSIGKRRESFTLNPPLLPSHRYWNSYSIHFSYQVTDNRKLLIEFQKRKKVKKKSQIRTPQFSSIIVQFLVLIKFFIDFLKKIEKIGNFFFQRIKINYFIKQI